MIDTVNIQKELQEIILKLGLVSQDDLNVYTQRSKENHHSLWQELKKEGVIDQACLDTLNMASKGYMPVSAARVSLEMRTQELKRESRTGSSSQVSSKSTTRRSQVQIKKLDPSNLESSHSGILKSRKNLESKISPIPPSKKEVSRQSAETSKDNVHDSHIPGINARSRMESEEPSVDEARKLYKNLEGKELGKYRFLSQLGRGASGRVFLGHHNLLNIPVAIKVLDPTLAVMKPEHVDRFFFEARTAASINHPNLIRVLDCGVEEALNMIVMEYAEGITIAEFLTINGTISEKKALSIVHGVALGLEAALEQGIIHRDVKPANIILTKSNQIKLADLGLAKNLKEDLSDTAEDVGLGTPYYFSPEQAQSASKADHRADIYALGVTLYHMLSGEVPFKGTTVSEIIFKHRNSLPKPLRQLGINVCGETEELIDKMMKKDQQQRYQTYGDLINGISEAIAAASEYHSPSGDQHPRSTSLVSKLWNSFSR